MPRRGGVPTALDRRLNCPTACWRQGPHPGRRGENCPSVGRRWQRSVIFMGNPPGLVWDATPSAEAG